MERNSWKCFTTDQLQLFTHNMQTITRWLHLTAISAVQIQLQHTTHRLQECTATYLVQSANIAALHLKCHLFPHLGEASCCFFLPFCLSTVNSNLSLQITLQNAVTGGSRVAISSKRWEGFRQHCGALQIMWLLRHMVPQTASSQAVQLIYSRI